MKKIVQILWMVLLLQCCFSMSGFTASVGDSNIESGGGGMGQTSSDNKWSSGNDGVRVTVVNAITHEPVTQPIDLTNKAPTSSLYHFGKVSKISYNNGSTLSPVEGGYISYTPQQEIPRIVSSSGSNNIEAIKSYFTDELIIRYIAELTGMNFEVLINGDYKLLLEPFVFFDFQGVTIATTATEAALYDQHVNGLLRLWMVSLTHKNLPLSMFLEVGDLGYCAWSGSTTTEASNADIIASLGIGIVRFEAEPEAPLVTTYDYEYRVNTEVISSIYVSGGASDPDDNTTVYFNIMGTTYTVNNIYYPEGDSQLVWVKWTTPSTPQRVTIEVSSVGKGKVEKSTIVCNIVDLNENPPPNPVADDRNDSFSSQGVPSRVVQTSTSWNVWEPWWQSQWEWESNWEWQRKDCEIDCPDDCSVTHGEWVDNGTWEDYGWWEFRLNQYNASIAGSMELKNDSYNPTGTEDTLKSGYGVTIEVDGRVSTNQSSGVSKTPNAVSYFPEFYYTTYWRLLERMETGSTSTFEFQKNSYSTYKNRTHFTPIWMPDGSYLVNTWLIDYWTPTGMLSMNLTDSLRIEGDLWKDWHIAPKDTN